MRSCRQVIERCHNAFGQLPAIPCPRGGCSACAGTEPWLSQSCTYVVCVAVAGSTAAHLALIRVTYHKFPPPRTLQRTRATIFSFNHSISYTEITRAGLVSALMAATSTRPRGCCCQDKAAAPIQYHQELQGTVSIFTQSEKVLQKTGQYFSQHKEVGECLSEQFPSCTTGTFLVMKDTCKKKFFTYLVQNFNSCRKGKSSEESFSLLLILLHFISKLKTVHLLPPCL